MKDIPAIKGKFYVSRLIEEGEHEHQDFKYAISDARKIARSISAFANNDGGRLLIGVKDNGNIVGIPNEEDIYMIQHAAEAFCVPPQDVEMTAYKTEHGKVVLKASIAKSPTRPVYVKEDGDKLTAYLRVKDENIAVPPLMIKAWEMQQKDSGQLFTFSSAEKALLAFLEENPLSSVEDYIYSAHISTATAENIVARLLAAGVIEMVHTPAGFRLMHNS
ncbi:MAG: helix-turn-helix domain-containing protein [Muribaculaceae bacterium]